MRGEGVKRKGRQRRLTDEQIERLYARVTATPVKQRSNLITQLAGQLYVGYSTLERYLTRARREHMARVSNTFHVEPQLTSDRAVV